MNQGIERTQPVEPKVHEPMLLPAALPTQHIVLTGANGSIGGQCVEAGLADGYQVRAFVRTCANLALSHPNLATVPGNIT